MSGRATLGSPSKTEWFDTTKFSVQAVGTLGNERRNQLSGPHYEHLDFSLFEDLSAFQEGTLQFRAECFNLTNTPTFANPNATIYPAGGRGFGTISSVNANYSQRMFQQALPKMSACQLDTASD